MNILIATNLNIRRNEVRAIARALNKNHKVTIACMNFDTPYRGMSFTADNAPVGTEQYMYKDVLGGRYGASLLSESKEAILNPESEGGEFDQIVVHEFYGTPADSVSIMLSDVMKAHTPDIVVCGISNGINMGSDIYASSHAGMAMMATIMGVPAVMLSTERMQGGHTVESLQNLCKFVSKNIEKFAKMNLPEHTFLNISFPNRERYDDIAGVKYTNMAKMNLRVTYEERKDTRGKPYYWAKLNHRGEVIADIDDEVTWFEKGYVTITPISIDSTDFDLLEKWSKDKDMQVK